MTHETAPRYRLAPGAEVFRLDDDTVVLRGRHASVEMKGRSASDFETRIAPRLDGTATAADIAGDIGLSSADALSALLDNLRRAGLLLTLSVAAHPDGGFLDYMEMMGADRNAIAERMADLQVVVFGAGALGADVVRHLAPLGLKRLSVCDPSWANGTDAAEAVGPLDGRLDEEAVREIATSHGFVFSCYGPRFPAVDHWVNRAVHAARTPALFCSVSAGKSFVGPLVFPFETACHACWQMRSVACSDGFRARMVFEEQSAGRCTPLLPPPPEPPHLAGLVAGMAVNEMLKATLAMGRPRLTEAILEFEPFHEGWTEHPVLRRPDCPVCSKKNS